MNKRIKDIFDKLLIIGVSMSLFLFFGIIIRGEKERSILEGRKLAHYERISLDTFVNSKYQDNLEEFLKDQLMLSGKSKSIYYQTETKLINELIIKNASSDELRYFKVKDNVYKLKYQDNLINKYFEFDEERKDKLDKTIDNFNKAFSTIDKPVYIYYISSSRSKDLTNNSRDLYYDYLEENLKGNIKIGLFEIKDYEEYKQYFYLTDHHWNHIGQYRGYTGIMNLLGINNILTPREKTYDIKFYGSYSRLALDTSVNDKFTVYEYDLPSFKTYVNGNEKEYGRKSRYKNNDYTKDFWTNRYGDYYGEDYAEILYDFNNNKENLLLIGTSYSNSINELIASNFNKTYVVDLRYIDEFILKDYVEEHNIDKVLIMGDYYSFVDTQLFGGVQ